MPPTPRTVRAASARRDRDRRRAIGLDLRRLREDAGLTQRAVALAVGIDPAHLLRIERGEVGADVEILDATASVLGADLSLRLYPQSGPMIHDRIQARMVEALLSALHRRWRPHVEVPVAGQARGVIDVVALDTGAPQLVAIEAQSHLSRLEQQIRWHREKAAALAGSELARLVGGALPPVGRVLLLRSTRASRDVARSFERTLEAAYPARSRDLYGSLTSDAAWPGDGIVWVTVDGVRTRLLEGPPPGVALGR